MNPITKTLEMLNCGQWTSGVIYDMIGETDVMLLI